MLRVGLGWDQHRLVEGRPLVLGGERLRHSSGLEGHSDADVLVHAVCDALLGALGLGDLGGHFPDDDPRHRGADSLGLLAQVVARVRQLGYHVVNLDSVIIAQEPRLAPHIEGMRRRLGEVLGCPRDVVSVKASSPERLGGLGQGQGIAAQAVVLLEQDPAGGPAAGEAG